MRLTVDMLELRVRQQGIRNIDDLQWATIESNGKLGFMLKPDNQYATKGDIQMILSTLVANMPNLANQNESCNLFTEIKNEWHAVEPLEHLKQQQYPDLFIKI